MSSIVGHALGGMLAATLVSGKRSPPELRRFFAVMALAAVLADFDVLVFLLLNPSNMTPHRGASHSLLFAVFGAAVLALASARLFSMSSRRLFACFAAAFFTHPLLDYLMGAGPEIHFFWPFSESGYLAPLKLVPTAYYGLSAAAWEDVLLDWRTYVGIGLEIAMFVPLLLLSRTAPSERRDLWLVSFAAFAVTIAIYNSSDIL